MTRIGRSFRRLQHRRWFAVAFDLAVVAVATVGLAIVAMLALSGCGPARPPVTTGADECVPNASRCSPGADSRPEICSPEHRWYRTAAEPCPAGSQCCLASSEDGPPIHACVPATHCVPESLAPTADTVRETSGAPLTPSEPTRDPFAGEGGTQ